MRGESQNEREERIKALWENLDTRKEGEVDLKGFKKGLKKIDHPLKNADGLLHDVLQAIDTSKDGQIQFNEFRVFVEQAEKELWQLFETIDRNHDGHLDKEELKSGFTRAGLTVSNSKLDQFFTEVDTNKDGVISFEEWRDFLLFLPANRSPSNLRAVISYYSATGNLNPEGDVHINEPLQGSGYFLAGGLAGVISRTATAPFDRLKVYLIAQTDVKAKAASIARSGAAAETAGWRNWPIVAATKDLWRAGGIRSLFAGNGLNVVKVMPESAIKFGAYEASKRMFAGLEGHKDPKQLLPISQFLSGGIGGMVSQCCVYPLDTLKFRMQCEVVEGGLHGNRLIASTARMMWKTNGIFAYFRGLPLGLIGMFPYAAIDLTTFEYLKSTLVSRKARLNHCHEEDAPLSNFSTGAIGAFSGALSASIVYPLNVLRTRLQAQGTILHKPTYTGITDVTVKTIQSEGVHGLFRGLTPNLLKVVPSVSISYIVYENSKRLLGLS